MEIKGALKGEIKGGITGKIKGLRLKGTVKGEIKVKQVKDELKVSLAINNPSKKVTKLCLHLVIYSMNLIKKNCSIWLQNIRWIIKSVNMFWKF